MALRFTTCLLPFMLLACTKSTSTDDAKTNVPTADTSESIPLTLDHAKISEDLRTLADDGWAGRFTKDLEHLGKAADYIAASHKRAGLTPVGSSYRADFEYVSGSEPGDAFIVWLERGPQTQQLDDGLVTPLSFSSKKAIVGGAVWLAESSANDVKGALAITPVPQGPLQPRLEALKDAGAAAVILVGEDIPKGHDLTDLDLAVGFMRRQDATPLGLPQGKPPAKPAALPDTKLSITRTEKRVMATAPNVLAWIEGSEHPDEIILLGAHYDHIGTKDFGTFCRGPADDPEPEDTICNGADDNASGTALLMAIARAFGNAGYRPKRSIVFAHFAGEELGLFGSRALFESPPDAAPFAGGKVVAMLNMDMVGKLGADGVQVGGEKTSSAWPALIETHAPSTLSIVHPDSVTGRSDHAHWMRDGVPILFFFTGLHADYHRTSDEFDGINFEGIGQIGTLVLGVAQAAADGVAIPPMPKKSDES